MTGLVGVILLLTFTSTTILHAGAGLKTIVPDAWVKVSDDPRVLLEGLAFDRKGNLFVCSVYTGEIFKITAGKKITSIFKDPRVKSCAAIDIHKDGRLFLSTYHGGKIVAINPDGTGYTEILTNVNGDKIVPDDMIFDSNGNFYFNNMKGSPLKPTGSVYRVSADLKKIDLIVDNLAFPNGICLAKGIMGEETRLWIGECLKNAIVRVDMLKDGIHTIPGVGVGYVAFTSGLGADSNAVDVDGNLYQCVYGSGKLTIISGKTACPVAQVLLPDREKGLHLGTTSVAFKPGTDTGYMTACHVGGAWIYTFKALGKAPVMFSHK